MSFVLVPHKFNNNSVLIQWQKNPNSFSHRTKFYYLGLRDSIPNHIHIYNKICSEKKNNVDMLILWKLIWVCDNRVHGLFMFARRHFACNAAHFEVVHLVRMGFSVWRFDCAKEHYWYCSSGYLLYFIFYYHSYIYLYPYLIFLFRVYFNSFSLRSTVRLP